MLARVGVDRSVELVFRELARLVLGGRLELALGRDLGVLRGDPRLERAIDRAAGSSGYTVEEHEIVLTGACADCV